MEEMTFDLLHSWLQVWFFDGNKYCCNLVPIFIHYISYSEQNYLQLPMIFVLLTKSKQLYYIHIMLYYYFFYENIISASSLNPLGLQSFDRNWLLPVKPTIHHFLSPKGLFRVLFLAILPILIMSLASSTIYILTTQR